MKERSWFWMGLVGITALTLVSGCASRPAQAGKSGTRADLGGASRSSARRLRVAPMDLTGSAGSFKKLDSVADTAGLPMELTVYKVVPANVTKDWFGERAGRLGVGDEVREDGDAFVARGSKASFVVDKQTGSFDYTTDEFAAQTKPIAHALTDEQYRASAEKFLGDAGLMESEAEFRDVNRGNVVGLFENGGWVEKPYMVEVRFSHKPLAGIAFDKGVGPKIVVQFGEDGRVLGATSVWRKVEPLGKYRLKTPQQALDAVKNGRGQLFDVGPDAQGTVDEVSTSYLNEPLGYKQLYVLPAYVMKGKTADGKPFTALTRAIPDEMLQVDESLNRGPKVPVSIGK
jgi:hypothetical protein